MNSSQGSTPVCLITGGSSGIGLATARRFAANGYHVSICGRNPGNLELARNEVLTQASGVEAQVLTQVADLSNVEEARQFGEATLDALGRIDVLINNASAAPLAPFGEIEPDAFENTINVSIRSLFYLTQFAWNHMQGRGGGNIINISSLAAIDPFPGFSLYGACKAWMDLMTHSLAGEGGELGIRVCSIRPGAVETPLLRGLFPDFPAEDCVQPAEIAEVAWQCVADPENYPTGQAFTVTRQSLQSE